uniref:Ganglioside GM2 activator n=1 Tax=Angiostrongylus cantonensis TaxID=6313 RepID=A0A0K0DI37_ANGCA
MKTDTVVLTDIHGESRSISFPGCYRAKISFRMKKPLKNPYIEAFLQLGQNIPCRSGGRTFVSNICTNITRTNWCPQSKNSQLRGMLVNKDTCTIGPILSEDFLTEVSLQQI